MSNTKTQNAVALTAVAVVLGAGVAAYGRYPDVPSAPERGTVTRADYESVDSGDSLDDVVRRFGEPRNRQDMDIEMPAIAKDVVPAGTEDVQCVFYQRADEAASLIQFCFDGNGKYTSKASY